MVWFLKVVHCKFDDKLHLPKNRGALINSFDEKNKWGKLCINLEQG